MWTEKSWRCVVTYTLPVLCFLHDHLLDLLHLLDAFDGFLGGLVHLADGLRLDELQRIGRRFRWSGSGDAGTCHVGGVILGRLYGEISKYNTKFITISLFGVMSNSIYLDLTKIYITAEKSVII